MSHPFAFYRFGSLQIADEAPTPPTSSPDSLPLDVVAVGWDTESAQWVVEQPPTSPVDRGRSPLTDWKWTP